MQNPNEGKQSVPPAAQTAVSTIAPPVTVAELERRLARWLPKLDEAAPAIVFHPRAGKTDGS
jgi:hypothetical protein